MIKRNIYGDIHIFLLSCYSTKRISARHFQRDSVTLKMKEMTPSVTKRNLPVVVVVVVVLWLCGAALGDVLQVSLQSQYCTHNPSFLSCNFLGTHEPVVLDSLARHGGQAVHTVYIHNAEKLLVASDLCFSLAAFNVHKIAYNGTPEACSPDQQFSFKLVDSSSNLVPPYVSMLEMQRSAAQEVVIDRDLKSFSVISSDIDHLKVSKPIMGHSVKVENSVINNLEKLHLESKSTLILYNVTVNKMARSSLYLKESSMNMWTGNIRTSLEQAIVLGLRASLSLKNTDGKISLSGIQELPAVPTAAPPTPTQQEHTAPGVPPPSLPTRRTPPCNRSSLIWVFPTVLAAVEAVIIIINCTNWFPSLKARKVPHGLEEAGQSVNRQTRAGANSYTTWYYNTEVPLTAVNRRQNTGNVYDKYK